MIFIETPVFTDEIYVHVSDNDYKELQTVLLIRPEAGKLIKGSNGLRKIRWKTKDSGKRGGLRIIYYWDNPNDKIYLLLPYLKSKKEDLTKQEIKILSKLISEYLK